MPAKKTARPTTASSKSDTCYHGACGMCHGVKILVLGVLVLLNVWFDVVGWAAFVGIVLVLLGLLKLVKPRCPHC